MEGKCALYRHFDGGGALLYVGISLRPFTRTKEHTVLSGWADQIANVRIEYFPTRKEALEAEARAVREENPTHNIRLRKPKKEPKTLIVAEERAEKEMINLTRRIIHFSPLYKPTEAAQQLGVSTRILNREIEAGNLAVTMIPSVKTEKLHPYITGWQLIDWLESRERQSIEGAN